MNTCENRLLNGLPQSDLTALIQDCELVQLFYGEVIFESDMNIENIYFPFDCVISLFNEYDEGKAKQIASINNEGAAGTEICFNENPSRLTAIITQTGWAYRIPKSSFLEGLSNLERFRSKLLNYAYIFNLQITSKDSEKQLIKSNKNILDFCEASENEFKKKWLLEEIKNFKYG